MSIVYKLWTFKQTSNNAHLPTENRRQRVYPANRNHDEASPILTATRVPNFRGRDSLSEEAFWCPSLPPFDTQLWVLMFQFNWNAHVVPIDKHISIQLKCTCRTNRQTHFNSIEMHVSFCTTLKFPFNWNQPVPMDRLVFPSWHNGYCAISPSTLQLWDYSGRGKCRALALLTSHHERHWFDADSPILTVPKGYVPNQNPMCMTLWCP